MQKVKFPAAQKHSGFFFFFTKRYIDFYLVMSGFMQKYFNKTIFRRKKLQLGLGYMIV